MSKLVWGINSGGMESGGEKTGGSPAGNDGSQAQSAAGSPGVKGLGTAEAAAIGTILTGTKVFLALPGQVAGQPGEPRDPGVFLLK